MNLLIAAFLGLVQGLAEFLPISSSGHLNLLQALFKVELDNQLLFNILLHVATLIPLLIIFWKDWWQMLRHPIRNNTLVLLFIASIPALVAKIVFGKKIDYFETHNIILGLCFLLTGLFLILAQWLGRRNEQKNQSDKNAGFLQAAAMGCMQVIGMVPGVSRSGSALLGGAATGLTRERAAKFSFMMSVPAILASLLSEGRAVLGSNALDSIGNYGYILVGMAVAAVSGYFAIRFMFRLIAKASLNWFALYVILLGILIIILQTVGVMTEPTETANLPEIAMIARIIL